MLLALLACGAPSDDDGSPSGKDPADDTTAADLSLTIASPSDGASFYTTDTIPLQVEATKDGEPVDPTQVAWTIGQWTGTGRDTEVSGLTAGAHTVEVSAKVEGEAFTASVGIEVVAPPEPLAYRGMLRADVRVHSNDWGDFDDSCQAPVDVTVDPSGPVTGSGTCEVFDQSLPFTIEGTIASGALSGDLVMVFDGQEGRTPFTGTGAYGDALAASFDSTQSSADGSVRISGTWDATPVP